MKDEYKTLIERLQQSCVDSTIEWGGKKATVKLSHKASGQGDICSKCLFRHLREDKDVCPIFKACCQPYRPDRQSVLFLDLERNREIINREIERNRLKREKKKKKGDEK